jgi:hypothetical protein
MFYGYIYQSVFERERDMYIIFAYNFGMTFCITASSACAVNSLLCSTLWIFADIPIQSLDNSYLPLT